jgi:hypothetical protein
MTHGGAGDETWKDIFSIDVNGVPINSPAFVCMFVGGSASYPSDINNGFKNDGIISIGTTTAKDFNSPIVKENGFYYGNVMAFKVKFGEQNQSMFTDIKIDSKEYPETNESLKLLSNMVDKPNTVITKGQNLYNVFENRAYRATITGLGNAMIQPTQYFQLDNVPIFNGAYLILSVEHTIEPNKMTTSFSGTKILRYPVPRVLNPSAIMNFLGGDTDQTSSVDISDIQVTEGTGMATNNPKGKYMSMYEFDIEKIWITKNK